VGGFEGFFFALAAPIYMYQNGGAIMDHKPPLKRWLVAVGK